MMPEEQDPEITDYEIQAADAVQRAELEATQLEQYAEKVFSKTNPKPEPYVMTEYIWEPFDMTDVTFLKERGVEAWINTAATVGGILFSAIRTAGIFAIAELKLLAGYAIDSALSTPLGWLAGASIVAIVEGVLAGFGWIRGKKSGNVNTSWTPLIIAGAIAALAGVLPSFELLPDTATNKAAIYDSVMWLLVLLSGPGIAYLVYVVTENFGFLHNEWQADVNRRKSDHDADQRRREQEYNMDQQTKYLMRQNEIRKWYEDLQADYRKLGRQRLFGGEQFINKRRSSTDDNNNHRQEPTKGIADLVREYLAEHNLTWEHVGEGDGYAVSPLQIAQEKNIIDKHGRLNNGAVRTVISRMRPKPA